MKKLLPGPLAAFAILGLMSLPALSQVSLEPDVTTPLNQVVIVVFCAFLVLGWTFHIWMVSLRLRELDGLDKNTSSPYSEFIVDWNTPARWTFFLTVMVLPVGLSLVSSIFPMTDNLSVSEISYQFAISIFIIMITLEIAALYNLVRDEWRPMLTAALTIDLVAFFGLGLLKEPQQRIADGPDLGLFMSVFFLGSGLASLGSSFLTLYHARTFDQFMSRHD